MKGFTEQVVSRWHRSFIKLKTKAKIFSWFNWPRNSLRWRIELRYLGGSVKKVTTMITIIYGSSSLSSFKETVRDSPSTRECSSFYSTKVIMIISTRRSSEENHTKNTKPSCSKQDLLIWYSDTAKNLTDSTTDYNTNLKKKHPSTIKTFSLISSKKLTRKTANWMWGSLKIIANTSALKNWKTLMISAKNIK